MKKNNIAENGTLKKANVFYKFAFGFLIGACFVTAPMINIAEALNLDWLQIASTIGTVSLTAGGMASAYLGDKKEKQQKEEEYEKE